MHLLLQFLNFLLQHVCPLINKAMLDPRGASARAHQAHFSAGSAAAKQGRRREASSQFRCMEYYHFPDTKALCSAVEELPRATSEYPGDDDLRYCDRELQGRLTPFST